MSLFRSLFLVGMLAAAGAAAQPVGNTAPADPVTWSISRVAEQDGSWTVIFRADIVPGWYLYSQQSFGDMGPMPTRIVFDTLAHAMPSGPSVEAGEHTVQGHDAVFDMEVKKFKGWAVFSQRLTVSDPKLPITGRLEFMSCDDRQCIFPDPKYFKLLLADDRSEWSPTAFTSQATAAAPDEPAQWTGLVADKGNGRWLLSFTATIDDGWYIYSQKDFGEGPIATRLSLDSTLTHARFTGEAQESGPEMIEGLDPIFEMVVRKFKHRVTFSREVAIDDPSVEVTGWIDYQVCNDESCIFPDPLKFRVNAAAGTVQVGSRPAGTSMPEAGECKYKLASVDLDAPVVKAVNEVGEVRASSSLWRIFFLGFIGGLVALLTPCVFPMIPLTVSFFTKGSEDKAKGLRNAMTYGGFILGIYLIFSLPFHLLGSVNADIFNEISTNEWLNIFFFVIFLVFAVSFFGYFEITLPSSWVNSMDAKASRFGGMIGIFFMALTLALVSFSCTGPILGSLLAGALTADGGAWQLTAGLGGFGLALALPFGLFAMFPSWLNSLPRSGSWLNSVKVVLGFAEIALAFKFLSNADLVKQRLIVPYELFMAIWVLCSLGIVLYLFGFIRFPHDSPVKSRSALRWTFIGIFTAATVYLAFGLRVDREKGTFTPMALMSGLAPPVWYSWLLPSEAEAFQDLDKALAHAREVGKPVMIDFTGWACVNCRKMEEHVWPEDGVRELIEDKYVLVSLYVDDKRKLPEAEQHLYTTCTGKQKEIRTLGNKWSTVQLETFVISSQPYYALISPEGRLLTDPVGYTPDVAEYKAFLERGLEGMKILEQRAGL